MTNTLQVLHAYRHIYRGSLRAVQYASPARHTLRTVINTAFRTGTANDFNPKKIKNTLALLKGAREARGLEHRLLKSMLHLWWFGGNTKSMKPEYVSSPYPKWDHGAEPLQPKAGQGGRHQAATVYLKASGKYNKDA